MDDSKEHDLKLGDDYDIELERTLGSVQLIQGMLLDKSLKQEALLAPKTYNPRKKLPAAKAYIEETKSPGIFSIKSPGMKSAKSLPKTAKQAPQPEGTTVTSPLVAPSVAKETGLDSSRDQGASSIRATIESNKEQIRQLLKESAKVCKQHDAEQKYLRLNILQPKDLKRFRLYKFVSKTFQIDVGNMCLPLKMNLQEIEGEYVVYLSFKQRWPNEANGYD